MRRLCTQWGICASVPTPIVVCLIDSWAERSMRAPARVVPLHLASLAPEATVDPELYVSPPLRPGSRGWFPEYGKAWQKWRVPTYTR